LKYFEQNHIDHVDDISKNWSNMCDVFSWSVRIAQDLPMICHYVSLLYTIQCVNTSWCEFGHGGTEIVYFLCESDHISDHQQRETVSGTKGIRRQSARCKQTTCEIARIVMQKGTIKDTHRQKPKKKHINK
jgi:hypothetical protein